MTDKLNTKSKVFIRSFGCQMNVRDTEVICGLLKADGWELISEPAGADMVIFNTCSVRQHAEDKVWSEIGRFKRKTQNAKRKNKVEINLRDSPQRPGTVPIIGIVGCMAQNYKEEIFQRAPNVDFVVGPSDLAKIPQIANELLRQTGLFERKIWETGGQVRPEEIYHTGFYEENDHAYVVISEGCSNYCSYCVVPYVRGQLRHRAPEEIIREINEAIAKGITKVTLLGQNVNAYVSSVKCKAQSSKLKLKMQNLTSEVSFPDLLRMVNKIKGLEEFSFITSHPKDTSLELFKAMTELEKLKKYLHLPVQSGSERILKLMNRGYTAKFYLDLIGEYRKMVKGVILTTDIIVGFPTEKEEDFQDTYHLLEAAQFDAAFIFKYSSRPNTEAAKLPDDVESKEKERRHKIILDLQKDISKKQKAKIHDF